MKKFVNGGIIHCTGPIDYLKTPIDASIRYFEDGTADVGCAHYTFNVDEQGHKCLAPPRELTCLHARSGSK